MTRGYWAPVLSLLFSDWLAILLGEAIQCIGMMLFFHPDTLQLVFAILLCYSQMAFLKLPLSIHLLCAEQNSVCVCVCVCVCTHLVAHLVVFNSLRPQGLQPARLLCPWHFPRQEYWSGLPFPHPGEPPDPGIKSASPTLAGGFWTTAPPGKLEQD